MAQSPEDPLAHLPPLRDVIAQYDLRAQKSLGQNFLLDKNITDKIARLAGDLRDVHVFEIGPGPGGLTRSLLRSGARHVTAVEFDPRAIRALQQLKEAAGERLELVQGDALAIDLIFVSPPPRAIVANLPYNIASVLLLRWLQQIRSNPQSFCSMTLMFQKEVAMRLTAAPGSKDYSRLSVMAQWLCQIKRVYDLPPTAFTPPPKVSSSVVHFVPRIMPAAAPSFEAMETVTATAFGQRRKMIRNTLKD
ncbi:MAG: 16S rRNA (adenine(1518)-N(6)/adenine(1519)-N(6))-dimethyltransferase RsmA, partial [Alphaproteobacteria bacterium]|nr:16S rRNA (adenine(1518)-N(6)/adenine(1519)-N(6))-dimethyltransferase RsmA [Alphaproteobacteria bacterium]